MRAVEAYRPSMSDGRSQSDPNAERRPGRDEGPREARDRRGRSDQRPDPRGGDRSSDVPGPIESARPPRLSDAPDDNGRFGAFGGVFWPETVVPSIKQLEEEYLRVQRDRDFWIQLAELHRTFIGRPTTLHLAQRLTDAVRARTPRGGTNEVKGARIWLKREDLAHSGGHSINSALGHGLLAQRMGKKCLVAESANGQHGVALGTVAAHLGLECEVFIGADDAGREGLNLARMRALGVSVRLVESGARTHQDALGEVLRRWQERADAYYVPSSVVGAHPYPAIVRDFQSIMGRETKAQSLRAFGKLPDAVVACVGGGSAAAGMFYHFLEDAKVALVGVHGGGIGEGPGDHAAVMLHGAPGIGQGTHTYVMQDGDGQIQRTRSCAAGLQRPVVGPELAYWKDAGRVRFVAVRDEQALAAFGELSRLEGIIPSLESAHAVAHACTLAAGFPSEANLVVCLSGGGEKDLDEVARLGGG